MNKIEEYFDSLAISQSDLIALSKSPYMFKRKKENKDTYTSDALILGSAVDCLLTDKDNWNNRFHVLTVQKPSGQMGEYVEKLANISNLCKTSEILLVNSKTAYDLVGFKRDSFDKVKKRFEKEGKEYYNELINCKDKEVISFEIYEQALEIKQDLLEGEYTKQYFIPTGSEEILFQTPIYFLYKNVECKALVDIIKINHKEKTITPADLKTTEFLPNFEDSIWKYRYDLQSSWYFLALNSCATKNFFNYYVNPFRFIVAEKSCRHKPWVFKASPYINGIGMYGGDIRGRHYKGYIELIHEYKQCKENNQWEYPVEMINGEIEI